MEVIELIQTCESCPSQWDFRTAAGYDGYARYRLGWLSVELLDGDNWRVILSEKIGDRFDGYIEWGEVYERIANMDEASSIEQSKRAAAEYFVRFRDDPAFREKLYRESYAEMREIALVCGDAELKARTAEQWTAEEDKFVEQSEFEYQKRYGSPWALISKEAQRQQEASSTF